MNIRKTSLIFILLTLFISLNTFGQTNLSKSSSESGYPSVAVNKDGVILAVWPEGSHEAGTLFYCVYKDGVWSSPHNTNITKIQGWSPQLDVDSEGNFYLAYADGSSRLNREIYYCVYNPDSGWETPVMIWNSPENSAWHKIDIDGNRICIIWHHEHTDPYTGYDIIMQSKLIEDEFWPSSYERLSWTAYDNSTHPAFKVRNDKIYVCYMEGVGDLMPWRIFFKEAPRGSAWQGIPVEEVAPLGYRPELEVDDDGNAHVVYSTKTGNFMYRRKIDGVWKGNEAISNKFSKQQFGDLRYRNNVLVATWVQEDEGGTSSYYAKKVTGGNWETPVQITQGSSALFSRIWIDDNGYGHFVWQDHGEVYYYKIAVPPPVPFLSSSTSSLSFTVDGAYPDPATFTLKNIGEGTLTFQVNKDADWMCVAPANGSLDSQEDVEITVDICDLTLEEGTYNGIIGISSPQALNSPLEIPVTLNFIAPPIFAPLNFTGETKENKALFYREYIHYISWQTNPDNRNIEKYRLYEVSGVNRYFIEEFSSSTFEYQRRHVDKDKTYTYELNAVDNKGRTGDAATLNINGTSVKTDLDVMMDMIGLVWFIQF